MGAAGVLPWGGASRRSALHAGEQKRSRDTSRRHAAWSDKRPWGEPQKGSPQPTLSHPSAVRTLLLRPWGSSLPPVLPGPPPPGSAAWTLLLRRGQRVRDLFAWRTLAADSTPLRGSGAPLPGAWEGLHVGRGPRMLTARPRCC